ncbi:MAG: hypothetical protein KatS3mg126_0451 [Lysobacteraceae bacterium]|nr:MAG: hypothetical protein KatS3mg126_0451 [Xanthomonadaceae bacterium]
MGVRVLLWAFLLGLALAAPASAATLALNEVPVGEVVEVPPFEYAPGRSFGKSLWLRRVEIYAPGARIWVPAADGSLREVPRTHWRYFLPDPARTSSKLFLAVAPDGGEVRGSLFEDGQVHGFAGWQRGGRLWMQRFEQPKDLPSTGFSCATGEGAWTLAGGPAPEEDPANALAAGKAGGLALATLAIDTDNELMSLRFSNDTSAATAYLADLVAGMNAAYERDLGVRLVQGTTLLRTSDVADPYNASTINGQLGEMGTVWSNGTLASVPRAFVTLLSGKSPSTNSGQGLAWVLDAGSAGNYCTAKSLNGSGGQVAGHYSAVWIIRGTGFPASTNVTLVGHEIGHNFGAQHTHCSDRNNGSGPVSTNTIDQCFAGESSCYSGPVSCPTDNSVPGKGSIMSYCNFSTGSGGAGCGSNLNEFHPAHQALFAPRVTSNLANGCFQQQVDQGPSLSPSPASGSTLTLPGGSQGQTVSSSIAFAVSGGSGAGTTQLSCSASGAAAIASGSPQTIAVGGSASPVVVQATLAASAQSGSVSCSAVRQNAGTENFSFTVSVPAGSSVCNGSGDCLFRDSFE